jgi:hypothetical protein
MNFVQLESMIEKMNCKNRRFRWRLTFAQRMLCRNQNRRVARGLPI